MTRKTQNSCRHFRAVPSSHTERAPISSSFIVSVPSHSPPQYTELSRTVLNLQLIVLTIQPATTQGLPLVGGSVPGNPKAPPPCAGAGVRGWSPRAFKFSSADCLRSADRRRQSRSTRPRYRAAAVTHLPGVGPPLRRLTAGGCIVANQGQPSAFSFQSQGRSRSSVCRHVLYRRTSSTSARRFPPLSWTNHEIGRAHV